ncbi:probable mitochondrial adenine nucleotide transporter BTL3, partial [Tanacetum coccineum]
LLASRLQSAGLQTKLLRHSDILCDGDGGFRRKNEILGNGFLSVSLNVNGSDGNLGKKLVAAGNGAGVVKKKKVGLRMRGKPAAVNTTKHLWATSSQGKRGFWKGNFVNILCTAPFKALNFCAYDSYRKQLLRLTRNEETTNFKRLFASVGAGMTASILCIPLEFVEFWK